MSNEWNFLHKTVFPRNANVTGIIVPNGDDAALLDFLGDNVVVTTDAFVEGRHFSNDYFTPQQIGAKAIEASISDVVAMGAYPKYILLSLAISDGASEPYLEQIYEGIYERCNTHQLHVVGGNIVSGVSEFQITVTVLGVLAKAKQPICRSGAKVGDLLVVTGELGGSHAGLLAFQNKIEGVEIVKKRHCEPRARVDSLATLGNYVHAMIDITDGLASEVRHLCKASTVGAIIDEASIPINSETRTVAHTLGDPVVQYAYSGGEDYELLVCVDPSVVTGALGTVIGVITEGLSIQKKVDGILLPLSEGGYDHLRSL